MIQKEKFFSERMSHFGLKRTTYCMILETEKYVNKEIKEEKTNNTNNYYIRGNCKYEFLLTVQIAIIRSCCRFLFHSSFFLFDIR